MGYDDTAEAVAYDKKYSPYKGAGGNEFLVVRSQKHTHDVGNDKSDEADHPCRVNGESHNEGADEKVPLAVKVEIRPHRDCRFIAEEHKVQHTALCPEKRTDTMITGAMTASSFHFAPARLPISQ